MLREPIVAGKIAHVSAIFVAGNRLIIKFVYNLNSDPRLETVTLNFQDFKREYKRKFVLKEFIEKRLIRLR